MWIMIKESRSFHVWFAIIICLLWLELAKTSTFLSVPEQEKNNEESDNVMWAFSEYRFEFNEGELAKWTCSGVAALDERQTSECEVCLVILTIDCRRGSLQKATRRWTSGQEHFWAKVDRSTNISGLKINSPAQWRFWALLFHRYQYFY